MMHTRIYFHNLPEQQKIHYKGSRFPLGGRSKQRAVAIMCVTITTQQCVYICSAATRERLLAPYVYIYTIVNMNNMK